MYTEENDQVLTEEDQANVDHGNAADDAVPTWLNTHNTEELTDAQKPAADTPTTTGAFEASALSLEEIAPRADDILEAAKVLAAAAKKIDSKRAEEKESREAAQQLQEEANAAFNARLEKRVDPEARSFEDVQKDVLKALKKLDKAAESADEETERSQAAYTELLSIITPAR